jgi:ferric-dicitrate binding protein FerR (iron transport regulator)
MNESHENRASKRDDIATLVRLAGKRQAVPAERTERVKLAARAQWRQEVRQRTRQRRAWTAAALVATAASLALAIALHVIPSGIGTPPGSDVVIAVEALTGPAWSRPAAGQARPLSVGDDIPSGSELSTAESGRAAIRLASGHSVRLDASTRIRLLDDGSLDLARGAIYVDSGFEGARAGGLEVRTALGLIEETGTQFEVRLIDDSVRVRLREGAVTLHREEQSHDVRAGTEIEMDPDGSLVRREIPIHGPTWDWMTAVTPMLDLEGRTARSFLDWIAREQGLRLAFEDVSVARSAEETVLQGGALEQLRLDEALDAVLPTCRMTHRIDRGVLLVAAAPEI